MSLRPLHLCLTLAAMAGLLAALLFLGAPPDGAEAWLGAVLLLFWMGGPIFLPFILCEGRGSERVRPAFLALMTAEAAFATWIFAAAEASRSSTAGFILLGMPGLGWLALFAVSFAIAAVTGWRPSLSGSPPAERPRSPPRA